MPDEPTIDADRTGRHAMQSPDAIVITHGQPDVPRAAYDAAEERREYVKDAWADVLATLAFVAGAAIMESVRLVVHHQDGLLRITLLFAEMGTAFAAMNHVVKMVWYRTFVGDGIRAAWRRLKARKSGRVGGPPPDGGSTTSLPADPQFNFDMFMNTATPDTPTMSLLTHTYHLRPSYSSRARKDHTQRFVEERHTFVLTHPAPGRAMKRATDSLLLGFVIALYFTLERSFTGNFSTADLVLQIVAGTLYLLGSSLYYIASAARSNKVAKRQKH